MTRLIVADDHDLFIEGLKDLLSRKPDIEFVGQAHDGLQAIEQISVINPDLILMDIAMPRMNGIQASKQIKEKFPHVKILMLSMHNNRELITESLKAGANGYVLKECSFEELYKAVNNVMEGYYYIVGSVLTILVEDYLRLLQSEDKNSSCPLSERELEVLKLIGEGLNTKQIAYELSISKNTVDVHRRHIMEKTGCNSPAELIKYAIREGF